MTDLVRQRSNTSSLRLIDKFCLARVYPGHNDTTFAPRFLAGPMSVLKPSDVTQIFHCRPSSDDHHCSEFSNKLSASKLSCVCSNSCRPKNRRSSCRSSTGAHVVCRPHRRNTYMQDESFRRSVVQPPCMLLYFFFLDKDSRV